MGRGLKLALALSVALPALGCLPKEWGANAILHPWRRPLVLSPDLPHESVTFSDGDVRLEGWLFRATGPRRGLIVYLHGIADNRQSGLGVAQRFVPRGYDVLVYDSRAHGRSTGEACTYGYYEKQDLVRALDAVSAHEAVLFGSSLGAAVALQAAAIEPRVRGVIAQSSFSDLRSIVRDRAPFFATAGDVADALTLAGRWAQFPPDEVSPERAAAQIHVPVLLLHGQKDHETRSLHSERIYRRLAGRRQLLIVPGAGHNDVLAREGVWQAIDAWLRDLESPSLGL
jgi:pimeloyl-ACP methyl ester carboxylesterase